MIALPGNGFSGKVRTIILIVDLPTSREGAKGG